MKIGAVILDYHVPSVLDGCLEGLLAQTWKDLSIVVVDRDTTSESRKRLQERYGKLSCVSIVPIVERLNFTRGVNVGIRYAHEKLGCDLVLVVDCGARLEPDVVEQVAGLYLAGIGVVSPSVYARDGSPQRPHYESASRGHLVRRPLADKLGGLFQVKSANRTKSRGRTKADYAFHGCAFFLTPDYFRYYHQLHPTDAFGWEATDLVCYLSKAGLRGVLAKTSPVVFTRVEAEGDPFGEAASAPSDWREVFGRMARTHRLLAMEPVEIRSRYN